MTKCIQCGDTFSLKEDEPYELCPKCWDYQQNIKCSIMCQGCNEVFEPDEVIDGLCPLCRCTNELFDDEEQSCDKPEIILVPLREDVLEDDYDN